MLILILNLHKLIDTIFVPQNGRNNSSEYRIVLDISNPASYPLSYPGPTTLTLACPHSTSQQSQSKGQSRWLIGRKNVPRYLAVCTLRGRGSIQGHRRVFQGTFSWLITGDASHIGLRGAKGRIALVRSGEKCLRSHDDHAMLMDQTGSMANQRKGQDARIGIWR